MALINGLYIFCEKEDVSKGVEVSSHPVEAGIDLTDHAKKKSTSLSLSGYIAGKSWADTKAEIEKLKDSSSLIQYVGRNVLSNMLITSFNTSSDRSIKDGEQFSMELVEVRIAKSPYMVSDGDVGLQQVEIATGAKTEQETKPQARTHTVKRGDTLWGLAKSYYGNGKEFPRIFEANRNLIKDPDLIVDGWVLVIP